jgi:iron complex transport system ATP-binding protein
MGSVVSLRDVSYRYGNTWALRGLDLEAFQGELIGILGPNGSGKSTLLKLIDGILQAQKGDVMIKERKVRNYSRGALAQEVAMVGQENHFRFFFTSIEIVLMGRFPHLGRYQFEKGHDVEVAVEALEVTDCFALAERSIHELSGGEKQRVLIARALAQEPSIILLDEPTSFLDLKYKREIFRLLASLAHEKGLCIMAVSHDIDLASQYCDRMVMLKEGRIHSAGVPEEVIVTSNVEDVFGCPIVVDKNPATGSPRVNLK